ncbi:MAG: nitroreductase family protein [Treponemataceae bacterium]|nr:nitroreductase family protein [Treponemataceae bacterium]
MIQAIRDRRSIRAFLDTPVNRQDIEDVLQSAVLAPSSKNRQPWKFVVVQGAAKNEMLEAFRTGIAREESGNALLPQSRVPIKYSFSHIKSKPKKNFDKMLVFFDVTHKMTAFPCRFISVMFWLASILIFLSSIGFSEKSRKSSR